MKPTIQDIKQSYDIVEVIGQRIRLTRQGSNYVGNCIFHNDEHASLKVTSKKNYFKCYPCGAGGDIIDFFTLQGKTIPEAINAITNGSVSTPAPRVQKPTNNWINAVPDQSRLPDPTQVKHARYDNPAATAWPYHNAQGNIIGFTCRFNLPEGKKDVLPYSFKQQIDNEGNPLGNAVWGWRELDKPRPLYNLHEILSRPNDPILMVEGEKTADAGKSLYPNFVVTTWIGGADNVKYTDFTPIQGRNVFMWPDNDTAGIHCMFGGWSKSETTGEYKKITGITQLVNANFKWVKNEQKFPKKWDIADAVWTPAQASEYLNSHINDLPSISEFPPNELPLPAVPIEPVPSVPELPSDPTPVPSKPKTNESGSSANKNSYFSCIGFENNDQNLYVFFVYRANVIVKLSAGGINTSNLLQLAPLNYWEGAFPKPTRSNGGVKFEINTIADFLINSCIKKGIFNPNIIRGRGAWIDNGKPVVHCGDKLIVEGKYIPFSKHKSKFIYEAGQELGFSLANPCTKFEAHKLIEMLERLQWTRKIDAVLLAGWIVTAPMCGALDWRSHLWITGASGTGKSKVMKMFVKRLLGEMLVDAQGETTAPGIRQYLKSDALPVTFDEAESEDKRGADRMQDIVGLARSSSTSDSGKIFKGSAGGSANQYDLRSSFAMSSIGANLQHRSDVSRFTVLELKKDESETKAERWKKTQEIYAEIVTDEFVQSFISRNILLLPTILKNAKTFSNAASIVLDNQRTGDQLGTLLAGAYACASDNIISVDDAKAWIAKHDWNTEKLAEGTRDEIKVLNKIIDAEIQVETLDGRRTRTVGELISQITNPIYTDYLLNKEIANITLRRNGMKVENGCVIFSDNSEFIRRALAGTQFNTNYHIILSRVDGAIKTDPTTFASGTKSRAVKIEVGVIFQDTQEDIDARQELIEIENKFYK